MSNTAIINLKQRTRCEVWTRVMGYHRPVSHFNIGKKSEHYSRKHFTEVAAANSQFIKKYSVINIIAGQLPTGLPATSYGLIIC